jgi:hypothetical protein
LPVFKTVEMVTLRLELGRTLAVDLQLGLPTRTESLAVQARTLVDVRESGAAVSIRDERLHLLPRGRDFSSVVAQATGASHEQKLGGLSIDGSSGAENRFVIDGVDTTHLKTGQQGKLLVTDMVEEVQVKYGGYAAEHGGSTGGVINVITKSGTNEWRGEVGAYYSSDALGVALDATPPAYADGRPTLRVVPTDNTRAEHVTYPKDHYVQWEPTLAIGGPLIKDRFWLFASYMPQLISRQRTITLHANGQTGNYSQRQRQHFASANLLGRVGPATRLRAVVNLNPASFDGTLPGLAGTDNPGIDFAAIGYRRPNMSISGTLDHAFSRRVHLSARGGYFRYDAYDVGVPHDPLFLFVTSNIGMPGVPPDMQRPRNYRTVPFNFAVTRDIQRKTSLYADLVRPHGQRPPARQPAAAGAPALGPSPGHDRRPRCPRRLRNIHGHPGAMDG